MELLTQLFRFASVGATSAVADFGSYSLLTRLIPFFYAHYLATSVGTSFLGASVAYTLHHLWTFRHPAPLSLSRYGKFLTVYGLGILWQNLLLALFVETIHIYDLAAKVLAILIVALCWNFLFAKKWVFRYTLET
ncbi:MAG: GtrA family protein [Patescibacteria group bacterium]|jgi:putative flippase GtrA